MPRSVKKIIVVTEHFTPNPTTTARYVAAITRSLAEQAEVLVVSGTRGSAAPAPQRVIEIKNRVPGKGSLVIRAIAETLFAIRAFWATLVNARRGDLIFTVTAPFTLPYAVVTAAWLRGASSALLMHDVFPEALEMSGLVRSNAVVARVMRMANGLMFRELDAIIVIGRDVKPLLLAYRGVEEGKIHFIPNWRTLAAAYRSRSLENRYRPKGGASLVVGLSGNLGFTHSAETVLQTARLMSGDSNVHFLLSGWGKGWGALKDAVAADPPGNVTLIPPAPEEDLATFLAAADVWVIPYRRGVAGVSVPSRLYNLLAVGRAIVVAAEAHSEAAMAVTEENVGWAIPAEDPRALADVLRAAAADMADTVQKGQRAAEVAVRYSPDAGLAAYRAALLPLLGPATVDRGA